MMMPQRSLHALINTDDPAWPLVQQWITGARQHVEVLPATRAQAEQVLLHLQVTTRSPLGALALETGGLVLDHGWLRVLGSGHERLRGTLQSWNSGGEPSAEAGLEGGLVIAHDAVGGFFALNGGAFAEKPGSVLYHAPDTLAWEVTHPSYTAFVQWALSGNLARFYKKMRWPGWQLELASLSGDQGISIYPFPFVKEGGPIARRSRRPVPMLELWHLYRDLAQRLSQLAPGTPFQIHFTSDKQTP